jgi:hypothetical protein
MLGMDNATNNKNLEEALFKININRLSEPIKNFVTDFKTWPKEEQNKITTFHTSDGRGYFINSKPAASDKYDKEYGLGFYLDCRLNAQQIEPFLDAIDYLKKQQ